MKKDDILTIEIEDLSSEGLGVGHSDGLTLFVKDTVIGDQVRVQVMKMKKNYGFARLLEILRPSEDRVTPPCPVARSCGGCQIQAMSYEAQLRFKQERVRNALKRIGGFENPPMEEILGMDEPWRYRNKAQYPVSRDREGHLIAGFYAGRTHSVIPCQDCLLGQEINQKILEIILGHMEENHIPPYDEKTGKGLVRHIMIRGGYFTGDLMVCLILNGDKLKKEEELIEKLKTIPGMKSISVNINKKQNNVIMGVKQRLLWGEAGIEDYIGDVRFRLSPLSFFQVNPRQTVRLYEKALEYANLTGKETVWDLYCGIGSISLFLARRAGKVYGVEIIPDAILDARENARLNGIENAEFFVGKAEELLPEKYEKEHIHADIMVIDPPRKGCDEAVLQTMLQMEPERIVYVSCDPATLARDLKILCEEKYKLVRACPVDMFGHSVHTETVALLSRTE